MSYSGRSPEFIKRKFIDSFSDPDSIWVETGTYMGDTTIYLAKRASRVYTIEPSREIASKVSFRFRKLNKIELSVGSSEEKFESIVSELKGKVCFFLDGHASGGNTFYGSTKAPIQFELMVVGKFIRNFTHLSVLVDDFRLFGETIKDLQEYPTKIYLIHWAESYGLEWHVQHDIFIAKSKGLK